MLCDGVWSMAAVPSAVILCAISNVRHVESCQTIRFIICNNNKAELLLLSLFGNKKRNVFAKLMICHC